MFDLGSKGLFLFTTGLNKATSQCSLYNKLLCDSTDQGHLMIVSLSISIDLQFLDY